MRNVKVDIMFSQCCQMPSNCCAIKSLIIIIIMIINVVVVAHLLKF